MMNKQQCNDCPHYYKKFHTYSIWIKDYITICGKYYVQLYYSDFDDENRSPHICDQCKEDGTYKKYEQNNKIEGEKNDRGTGKTCIRKYGFSSVDN